MFHTGLSLLRPTVMDGWKQDSGSPGCNEWNVDCEDWHCVGWQWIRSLQDRHFSVGQHWDSKSIQSMYINVYNTLDSTLTWQRRTVLSPHVRRWSGLSISCVCTATVDYAINGTTNVGILNDRPLLTVCDRPWANTISVPDNHVISTVSMSLMGPFCGDLSLTVTLLSRLLLARQHFSVCSARVPHNDSSRSLVHVTGIAWNCDYFKCPKMFLVTEGATTTDNNDTSSQSTHLTSIPT